MKLSLHKNLFFIFYVLILILANPINAQSLKKYETNASADFQYTLGKLYEDGVPVEIDGVLINNNPKLALKWYLLAAQQGNNQAILALARFYLNGIVVPKNIPKAIELYTSVAETGDDEAILTLAKLYTTTSFGEVNHKLAIKYLGNASDLGNAEAKGLLAEYYYSGVHVPADYSIAFKFAKAAFEKNEPLGSYYLGLMYLRGLGTPKNDNLGVQALIIAANNGIVAAQSLLGLTFYKSNSIKQDMDRAYIWLKIAVTNGNESLITTLNELTSNLPNRRYTEDLYLKTIQRLPRAIIR